MSPTIVITTPTLAYPSSPDPTPLRMLAFSVAEAALQPDPNSPSLGSLASSEPSRWSRDWTEWTVQHRHRQEKSKSTQEQSQKQAQKQKRTLSQKGSRAQLWDVVVRAKERRQRDSDNIPTVPEPLPSPPVSPTYNFVLPPNSPLAASIAATTTTYTSASATSVNTPTERHNRPAALSLSRSFPLVTRSAEPSPTKSTFSALDQTRPPPEFKPRLTAKEFSRLSKHASSSKHTRTKSANMSATSALDVRRLPSLAQIQAKMSTMSMVIPRTARTNSDDSIELQTPTDERPSLAILSRRPPTPPSPKLAPFLRERISERLANTTAATTAATTTPPPRRPVLKVTPPSFDIRPAAIPPAYLTPTRASFDALAVSTPPRAPSSPTTSIASTASPTLSVPIITCTPAPQTVLRDGIEHESDEDEDDVIVFDGEAEETKEREERERRGKEMRDRLMRRRSSD
jgi:hypothetical protein